MFDWRDKQIEVVGDNLMSKVNSSKKLLVNRDINKKKVLFEVILFASLWLFQVLLNKNEIVPRSLPDEIGAMGFSAWLAGDDWSNVLAEANMYYGFGTTLIAFPLFKITKDPLLIYQIFLAWGAFLRTLPLLVCYRINDRFLHINDRIIWTFVCIVAIIGAPTRATNIDNEPLLIAAGWSLFYLLLLLQTENNNKNIKKYSLCCAVVMAISFTAHTRAMVYAIAFVFVVMIYYVVYRKWLINWIYFSVPMIMGWGFATFLRNLVKKLVYTNQSVEAGTLNNTVGSLKESVASGVIDIFTSTEHLKAMISLLLSNLWIVFVYYCGILVFIMLYILYSFFRKKGKTDVLLFSALFPLGVFVISLIGLGITWMFDPISVWEEGKDLSRGYFYLRYYGNVFGPLLLVACSFLHSKNVVNKRVVYIISLIGIVACKFTIMNSISVAIENGKYQGDWFGYFSALSFSNYKFRITNQDYKYYFVATGMSVLIFIVIIVLKERKFEKYALATLAGLIIFEYSFGVLMWDRPFTRGNDYYGAVDEIYNVKMKSDFFSDYNEVYYIDDKMGRQFVMQFILFDKQLIYSEPRELSEDMIVIATNIDSVNKYVNDNDIKIIILDDNEIVITNNDDKISKLIKLGYEIYDE